MRPGFLVAFAVACSFFGGAVIMKPELGSLRWHGLLLIPAAFAMARLASHNSEYDGWRRGFARREDLENKRGE